MPPKRSASHEEPRSPAKRSAAPIPDVGSPVAKSAAPPPDIGSPLKRVKAAIKQRALAHAHRDEVVLSTVEGFREYVAKESDPPSTDIDVVITGTLIWKSAHTFNQKDLVRLHITDEKPADPFDELVEFETLYKSSKDNQNLVETVLLTATIFGEAIDSPALPANGSVIRITKSRQRLLYQGDKCQLITRVADIVTL